jgi:hypothetical protein
VGTGVGESEAELEEHPAKIAVNPISQPMVERTLVIGDKANLWLERG